MKRFILGFNTANEKSRMVIYLWLINFLFSLMIVTPFYFLISKEFSRSLMGDSLAKGFDFMWFGDIAYKYQDISAALVGWFLVPGIIFLLLYTFLNGGIVGRIVAHREKINIRNFYADCGKYFFRLFRVFLISLIGYAVVVGVIYKIISSLFKLWTKNASTEWPLIISSNLKFLIFILLFSAIRMFFDYVKIRLVVEDSKSAIKATILTFSFIGKRFFKAWFLYLFVGIIGLLFALIYIGISRVLPYSGFFIVILFIWQQIYILTRMWIKILFFSTEYHFLIHHKTFLP